MAPNPALSVEIVLPSPEATEMLARAVADQLGPGDTVLIEGPIGAGKSHFCRAAIRQLMAKADLTEDVPSPTFTLVQTYLLDVGEVWHSDLYRLTEPSQAIELGLEEAFETAIVLVEWPERLGALAPKNALTLTLSPGQSESARTARLSATDMRWQKLAEPLATLLEHFTHV